MYKTIISLIFFPSRYNFIIKCLMMFLTVIVTDMLSGPSFQEKQKSGETACPLCFFRSVQGCKEPRFRVFCIL